MAKYLLCCLLALFPLGCLYGDPEIGENDMARKYPHIADDHEQRIVPRVAPVIARNGSWSANNQLGYMAKYGPDDRGEQTILKLDEWGPPEIWTVSLFVEEKFADFNGFGIKAKIGFGAGGSTQTYECDWLNGTQISLPMNAVNVVAQFQDVDVASEGGGLSVGVQLSRGSRGGTKPPILTISEATFFGAGGLDFLLPQFAKEAVLIPMYGNSTTALDAFYSNKVSLHTSSGIGSGSHEIASATGDRAIGPEIRLPITGQARRIHVNNLSSVNFEATLYVELDG